MSCEHLVCAACAGPVVEGRCPACRASRPHVHGSGSPWLTRQAVAALVALASLLLLVLLQAAD